MWMEELARDNPMETFLVEKFLINQWNTKKNMQILLGT